MEKVMAMNGFEELKENELMDIEGGIPIIPLALLVVGAALTLTGCGPESTPEDSGSRYLHKQLHCDVYDSCVDEDPNCPYH